MHITSISSWALTIWKTLESEGSDPKVVFTQAGADPHILSDPEGRYSLETMFQLWRATAEVTGDVAIGARIGQQWDVTTFHALGFAWLASSSLAEAFERLHRYVAVVNNGLIAQTCRQGSMVGIQLSCHTHPELIHDMAMDAGIAAVIKMSKMLVGEHFTPVYLDLTRAHPVPSAISALIAEPVRYSAPRSALWVDCRTAEKVLLTGNESLALSNEQVASAYLDRLLQGDIELSAFNLIVEQLPSGGVSEEWLAEKLHMSVRTLRRKLAQHGTSFRELLNNIRKENALRYIKETNLGLIEIAYLLGFSDQGNFTRAFKRWYQMPPSECRAARQKQRQAVIGG